MSGTYFSTRLTLRNHKKQGGENLGFMYAIFK